MRSSGSIVGSRGSPILDMSLPAPLVYGIHDAWPHLAILAREAGFSDADGRTEVQFVIALDRDRCAGRAADRRAHRAPTTACVRRRVHGDVEWSRDRSARGRRRLHSSRLDVAQRRLGRHQQPRASSRITVASEWPVGCCVMPRRGCGWAGAATSSATSATTSSNRRCTRGTWPTDSRSSTAPVAAGPACRDVSRTGEEKPGSAVRRSCSTASRRGQQEVDAHNGLVFAWKRAISGSPAAHAAVCRHVAMEACGIREGATPLSRPTWRRCISPAPW